MSDTDSTPIAETPAPAAASTAPAVAALPTTMRRVVVRKHLPLSSSRAPTRAEFEESLEIQEVPLPVPKTGELLVKVTYSPINPSDLAHLAGMYGGVVRECPFSTGFEGCGVVVAVGGGIFTWRAIGKRVSFYADAAWAEYVVIDALKAVTLPDDVTDETGACALVNPLTANAFIREAKDGNHKVILHTAAASSLGKMLIRLGKAEGITVICVVRRQEQADACRAAGAEHIVDTSSSEFANELKEVVTRLDCRLAYCAIGGPLSGQILNAMPNRSTLKVYGGLSGQAIDGVTIPSLVFQEKTLTGFWVPKYMESLNKLSLLLFIRQTTALLSTALSTEARKKYPLEQIVDALVDYQSNMSGGKILLQPHAV